MIHRSVLDTRKPIQHVPALPGVPGTGRFGSPAVDVYACVGCGDVCIHYHPDAYPPPQFPPPELCPLCEYRLGLKDYGHSFEDEYQPEDTAESVTGRTCVSCGVNIDHLRPQATTCSAKCRKALSRKKTG